MSTSLHIERFVLGEWATNCYALHDAAGRCWLVDAGFAPEAMLAYLEARGLEPGRLILTHAHVDHIAGVAAVRERYPRIEILIHEAEEEFLTNPALNLSIMLEQPIMAPQATGTLTHGERLRLGEMDFEVRHTPGHSPGGITLYQADEQVALVGDALFAGSIGRTDFPTSDGPLLIESIKAQLLTLPDATRVLPGHGPETTIGDERAGNPFLGQGDRGG